VGAARPGVFLYGGGVGPDLPAPEPVATVRARVVRVREAAHGDSAGYGATYRAEGPERWATLAIGYADGLPRALGGRGRALIAGRAVPLIGRISMDMTVANISGLDGVEPGDIATLIGRDGDTHVTVDEVARLSGTISYEVLTGFAPRLPRIWMDDGAG
jgi:alanine racemase